ncbi:hypothetical protein RJT34_11724 [Clitoria ternatea]|uniref:Exocyst subunit Exo70 family protein n=1 Tax=Clitoria ternatea TaxID=43366 RepID=A0AAN9PJY2_CLITE
MLKLIQVLRWLMQPKVWRFLCFASSVVGLLCYALSSSFNHLLGNWTWWKILLYTVFCFVICLSVLFPKAWQHSTTLRLKTHLAFLVLIITSVYSFFLDKAVKGKPDAYSMISYAAFAIMSLGLSRQIHCGFQIDLLYFFSGCLIIQFMKIKLWLVFVGASVSYSLIILRSSLDVSSQNGHLEFQDQDQLEIEVDLHSQETNSDNAQPENGLGSVVTQVDLPLQESYCDSDNTNSIKARLVGCIEALKKENGNLISMISDQVIVKKYVEGVVEHHISMMQLLPDFNFMVDVLPLEITKNLHEMVKLMVASGFEEECCREYSRCRREFLEQCLSALGLQALNMMDIETWIKACKVVLRVLLPCERRLCHHVFFGFSSAADISFKELCRELMISLLSFADAFATGIHSPNLFCDVIPRVFKALSNQILEYELLFSDQHSVSLKNKALEVWKRLKEANEGIFVMLESFICRDMVKAIVAGGGLHPVTCDVMKCLREVWEARYINRKLEHITTYKGEKFSVIFIQFTRTIELLESNLEANSKKYTDPALGYVFMMNNLMYIEAEARKWKTGALWGKDWFQKNTKKVQQYLELYQRTSWNKILDFLKQDNHEPLALNITAESMKEKLNLFNTHFKEICNVQSTWSVYSKQQREHIRISIENILLPAYGNFIGRFQDVLDKHAYDYIEYGMLDIQDQLNRLFLAINHTVHTTIQEST